MSVTSPAPADAADRAPESYRAAWESKPVLRAIYHDLYRHLTESCRPGRTLEIGGGSGNLKTLLPEVVSSDIVVSPWLDTVADAQALPFDDAVFDNVVMVDVLHHLGRPKLFFAEAERVLRPGGRIVMIEPGITPVSWLFYTLLHDEPVRMRVDPLADTPLLDETNPWDANQAIPTLLFGGDCKRFEAAFPALAVQRVERLSLFAYPLSGGFKSWQLLPTSTVGPLLSFEEKVMPLLGRLMAYRLLIVVERR
jgi:SAM-dependent methyltransferase